MTWPSERRFDYPGSVPNDRELLLEIIGRLRLIENMLQSANAAGHGTGETAEGSAKS